MTRSVPLQLSKLFQGDRTKSLSSDDGITSQFRNLSSRLVQQRSFRGVKRWGTFGVTFCPYGYPGRLVERWTAAAVGACMVYIQHMGIKKNTDTQQGKHKLFYVLYM